MSERSAVPHGESLRAAVRWLAQQPGRDTATLEEAGWRFDLGPLEQEFLRREFGPWKRSGGDED